MKKLLLPAVLLFTFALASCSRYQVNVISSTNSRQNQESGDFEFENDSVKISYSFYGIDAPVQVTVYNKLDKPQYVDWQKSAVIVGNEAISYTPDKININGNVAAQTNTYKAFSTPVTGTPSYTSGNINAVASLPQSTTFLPPHTQSTMATVRLANGFLPVPDSAYKKVRMLHSGYDPTGFTKVNTAYFEQGNSPLAFKSYLTMYTVDGSQSSPVVYQQSFYVSKTFTTLSSPTNFAGFEQKRGYYFVTSKATGYAKTMTVVGAAALIGGAAAVAEKNHEGSK